MYLLSFSYSRGLYIGKYPSPQEQNISRCHLEEKYEKGKRIKGKIQSKRKKGEKGRKWER
jgi:hypothetical protein